MSDGEQRWLDRLPQALVTLLQTEARVKVERKAGMVDCSIDVEKQATDTGLIDRLVTIVGGMFGR